MSCVWSVRVCVQNFAAFRRRYAIDKINKLSNIYLFVIVSFYRPMHYSAKRGLAITCCLSVRLSVTLVDRDHIGWNSSKIISPSVSPGCSLFANQTLRVYSKGNTSNFFRIVIRQIFGIGETLHRRNVNNYRQNYDIVY